MSAVLPLVTRLSSRVVRLLGCNASPYTLQGTNTYLVGTGARRVLIDCGSKGVDEYLEVLKEFLEGERAAVSRIVITHWHPDHAGGLCGVMDSLDLKPALCPVAKFMDTAHDPPLVVPYEYVDDGSVISVEGATLRVVHTPGHTSDHMALVLEEENVLFSGDCILGEGRGVVFEDLSLYLESLKKMATLRPLFIYPGHGPIVEDPLQRIEEYMSRQLEREARIVAAIAESSSSSLESGLTIKEIFQRVWKDAPSTKAEGIMYNLKKHLNKLLNEKKLKKVDPPMSSHHTDDDDEREAQVRFYISSSL